MSVNHYLLPISDDELASVLRTPEEIRALVERRSADVQGLGEDGVAIVTLTAESDDDPLAFIRTGAPDEVSGWVGRYAEEGGRCVECEVDMGYGPASYYRNVFLWEVARKLTSITADAFAANYDPDWLEENHVYPAGWHDPGRKETLIESFVLYRPCIVAAAKSGQHLLVWCAKGRKINRCSGPGGRRGPRGTVTGTRLLRRAGHFRRREKVLTSPVGFECMPGSMRSKRSGPWHPRTPPYPPFPIGRSPARTLHRRRIDAAVRWRMTRPGNWGWESTDPADSDAYRRGRSCRRRT